MPALPAGNVLERPGPRPVPRVPAGILLGEGAGHGVRAVRGGNCLRFAGWQLEFTVRRVFPGNSRAGARHARVPALPRGFLQRAGQGHGVHAVRSGPLPSLRRVQERRGLRAVPDEPGWHVRRRTRNGGVRSVPRGNVRGRGGTRGVQEGAGGIVPGQVGFELVRREDAVSHRDVRRGSRRGDLHRLPHGVLRRKRG